MRKEVLGPKHSTNEKRHKYTIMIYVLQNIWVSGRFNFARHESLNQPMIHFDAAISANESETENKNETKSNRPTEII